VLGGPARLCRAEGGGERSELVDHGSPDGPPRLAWRRGCSPQRRFAPGGRELVCPPRDRAERGSAGGGGGDRPGVAGSRGAVSGANSWTTSPDGPPRLAWRRGCSPQRSLLGGENLFVSRPSGAREWGGPARRSRVESGANSWTTSPDGPPRLAWRRGCSPQRRFAPGGSVEPLGYLFVPPRPGAVWGDRPGECRVEGGGERSELVDHLSGRPPSPRLAARLLPPTSLRSWGEKPPGVLVCPPSAGGRLGGPARRSRVEGGGERSELVITASRDGPPRLAWRRGCSPQRRFAPGGEP
jgi:hypothetical protein